ncbi:MAG TPA: group I intron-associated PD-(D/E)XK endonuclease [Terriglobales bacterium]|jgi:hypothetical protein
MKNQRKQKQIIIIPDKKSRGEWAEMCFLVAAAEHGLQVSKPWGEMSQYDFVTGHENRLVRVQVKSTIYKIKDSRVKDTYSCAVRGGHRPYVGNVFDFVAAYVIPEDIWYIIPLAEIYGRGTISLHPHATKINDEHMKYEKYKEAWRLLRSASVNSLSESKLIPCKITNIEACVGGLTLPQLVPTAFLIGCHSERSEGSMHLSVISQLTTGAELEVPHPSAGFARVGSLTLIF